MTSRKKPGVAFWATVVVVVLLVAYPFTWGPWVWLKMTYKQPRCLYSAGDSAFTPLRALRKRGMLPEWYIRNYEEWVASAVRINHGPMR